MQIKHMTRDKEDDNGDKDFLKITAGISPKKFREILDGNIAIRGNYTLNGENYISTAIIPIRLTNYSGFGDNLFRIAEAED